MEDDRELLETLRALAADGPQGAPVRVERQLVAEFRKRGRRRRARIWASFAGVAAIAAGIALFAWVRHVPAAAAGPAVEEAAEASFYPLPQAEALPDVEDAMVVRVQLPVSSLRLMGFPMDEEGAEERAEEGADDAVQAELLLGQDGLARGVRLAQEF